MKYTVRLITPTDDPGVERVIRSCLKEYHADHPGTAWTDPDLGRFSQIYNTANARYWVATDETGAVVGGVGIGPLPGEETVCELQKMYCLPSARGTGLGHLLLETALGFAKTRYDRCYLETLENMTAARKFYEKHGFVRLDRPLGKTAHFSCDVRYLLEMN